MARSTPVSSVMTTDVLAFSPDDNVRDAMRRMVDRGIDGAPVLDAGGALVGMLTSSDLIVQEAKIHFPTVVSILGATIERPKEKERFDKDMEKALGASVGEVMHSDAVSIGPEDTIEDAATLMHDHDVSRLPVVGDSGLVGIIGRTDILRAIIREPGEATPSA
jgi:CBS domain-containing protein